MKNAKQKQQKKIQQSDRNWKELKQNENLDTKQVGRRTAAKAVMKCLLHLMMIYHHIL